MKIELWGSYSPPIGGVSIHVMRLLHSLNKKRFILLRNFKGKPNTEYEYIYIM